MSVISVKASYSIAFTVHCRVCSFVVCGIASQLKNDAATNIAQWVPIRLCCHTFWIASPKVLLETCCIPLLSLTLTYLLKYFLKLTIQGLPSCSHSLRPKCSCLAYSRIFQAAAQKQIARFCKGSEKGCFSWSNELAMGSGTFCVPKEGVGLWRFVKFDAVDSEFDRSLL